MKIINFIDRVLWASRMGALTSPNNWGRCSHCEDVLPWVTNSPSGDYTCTTCGDDQSSTD